MLDPQSFEDLASLLQRRGRLRGIVCAQGWAEAEKAKAQRNPAAMREHEQIFGQAPRTRRKRDDLFTERGKIRTVYVPQDLLTEVQLWVQEYQRLKVLIHEIS